MISTNIVSRITFSALYLKYDAICATICELGYMLECKSGRFQLFFASTNFRGGHSNKWGIKGGNLLDEEKNKGLLIFKGKI